MKAAKITKRENAWGWKKTRYAMKDKETQRGLKRMFKTKDPRRNERENHIHRK